MNRNRYEYFRLAILFDLHTELTWFNKKVMALVAQIAKNFEKLAI